MATFSNEKDSSVSCCVILYLIIYSIKLPFTFPVTCPVVSHTLVCRYSIIEFSAVCVFFILIYLLYICLTDISMPFLCARFLSRFFLFYAIYCVMPHLIFYGIEFPFTFLFSHSIVYHLLPCFVYHTLSWHYSLTNCSAFASPHFND